MKLHFLPTLRAKFALNHSNAQEALDILRVAAPYELGLPALGFYNWPNLYPVYVRGEAYLAAHALWVVQQLREAWAYKQPHRFLLFDRDSKFGADVVPAVRDIGSQPIRTAFRRERCCRALGWKLPTGRRIGEAFASRVLLTLFQRDRIFGRDS